jgi:anti-anti-sigma factor
MAWHEEKTETLLIIHLTGDIDLATSPSLRAQLKCHADTRQPVVLLNFAEVNYIDSSGLATIIEYYKSAKTFDGKIGLACMKPRVKSVFEIVRLTELFQAFDSIDEAKAALISSGP